MHSINEQNYHRVIQETISVLSAAINFLGKSKENHTQITMLNGAIKQLRVALRTKSKSKKEKQPYYTNKIQEFLNKKNNIKIEVEDAEESGEV